MKKNKFTIFSVVFIVIIACISFFDDFLRDFLNDSTIILTFYIFGIIGIFSAIIALNRHKRESNKFSIYSIFLVTLIIATILFLLLMFPCQCGRSKAIDASLIFNLRQIGLIAEMIHDEENSYVSLCDNLNTLNDKHANYGNELKYSEDDIIEVLKASKEKNTNPVCFASDDSYCVSVPAKYSDGYYCIDNSQITSSVYKQCDSFIKCSVQ